MPGFLIVDLIFGASNRGLVGYMDDKYWKEGRSMWWTGGGSKESGVYGLGVILLELLSGRRC